MEKRLQRGASSLKRLVAFFVLLLLANVTMAQITLKGKVVDAVTKEPLTGAAVTIKGSTIGTTADIEGEFTLKVKETPVVLVVGFVSYNSKEVNITAKGNAVLPAIELESNITTMSEIVVKANSVAIDRKTPVAVSTITSAVIEEKLGSQEFPELLKSTPGVYATRVGGGFGDSRINLRGFQSENIAVMINGVPINGMENGKVYWSNWAGLSDVTRSMQVQRGLGASKVAVPSVGGTINITTRTIDVIKGGSIFQGIGNDGYSKTTFTYSSGLMDNGWAFTILGGRNVGKGWADGLDYEGYNYFFNVSKKINQKHTLALTAFGAPQTHAQRYDRLYINEYRDAAQGIKYNPNWGYYNGEFKSLSVNKYHKPQISLNHNWTIDETSFLSTSVYGSVASGGGIAYTGSLKFNDFRTNGAYSPVNIDAIAQKNIANQDGSALGYMRNSVNDHQWYGILSTYTKKLNDKFDILAGIDGRYYRGKHYQLVDDLLGASYVADNTNKNNPFNRAKTGDKIAFNNDGVIGWEGAFVQGEYSEGPVSAFVSLSGSNTSYQRIDYFMFLNSDPNQKSKKVNIFGFQTKGGINYNLTEKHNVFANIGYFEKAPFFNAVFMNNSNTVNNNFKREKIASYELGYGFRTSAFSANLNLYYTDWKDKSFTRSFSRGEERFFGNFSGVNALHKGVELDFAYRPTNKFTMKGMLSVGDWKWTNNLQKLEIYDDQQQVVDTYGPVYMKGLKVGDSPQTTLALGANYDLFENFKIGIDYNYYANYSSDFNPTTLLKENLVAWKVPNYSLLDVNAVFKMKIAGLNTSLFANVNNLFNTEYISDGYANFQNGISNAANTQVFYGTGRTWTTGLKVNF
ncbi:TonB-dependent receptor [Pseudopedobacter saltans DSM 12145]|uniref:TonB-dependent receptor n=1 Tax=Pseudopedobacter saltans (strain ATCC 51119 / DSM 12145 / JCM 21818 / CCUG 39354 / LMG 10337 / NBRC 100064 / NCIMB 13643) TaxID=762903 RepID=F0S5V1_PSESL|nr:TonB-dependent receptor [Pseudopedobacter saltans]ADY51022.1 TonB-dependent receptor [Pseudopedobacter saltans DSM 12145]